MSNTPFAPASSRRGNSQTWVKSQWKNPAFQGQISAEINKQEADESKTPKTRLDWPAEFKDEVLARLLALNAKRAAAERAAGLSVVQDEDGGELDDEKDSE